MSITVLKPRPKDLELAPAQRLPLPLGPFKCVHADPAWQFKTYTPDVGNRDVRNHYRTMRLAEIKAMPVADCVWRDAHLFLWTTGPCLKQAFEVIDAWGFKYSGLGFVWVKLLKRYNQRSMHVLTDLSADFHMGGGYTTRKNTEIVLLARRGKVRRISKGVRELIISPLREHSRKPDEIYPRIESYCEGPYLDLFSRKSRPGWTSWGDEAGKFDEQQMREAS